MNRTIVLSLLLVFTLISFSCSSEDKTLKISPSSLKFGTTNIGDSESLQLTLKNKYGKDIKITNITLNGSGDFTIVQGGNVPINLLKNAEHVIEIKFEPTSAGILASLMTIVHDAATKPKEVDLKGEGIPVPRMDISDKSYDFGIVYVSVSKTNDFIISNVGTADLSVTNIALTGANAALYAISAGNAPFSITPGLNHTFTLEFSPTTDGTFPIALEIIHDAVNETQPLSIPIDGEGVTFAPEIMFNETSPWDIGSHSTAAPSILDLEITSDGVDPLTVSSASFVTGTNYAVDEVRDNNGNVVNLPQLIPVGNKITLKIEFSPSANSAYNDTLTIVHDAINEATPYDFQFEGEGRVPIVKTFSYSGSIENWTVPAGVTMLTIEVWGAEGGGDAGVGGKGARMKGDFTVSPGDTLKILTGQKGKDSGTSYSSKGGGGGGASYVCKSNNDAIIIAGGGGGKTNSGTYSTIDGRTTEDGGDTYSDGGGNNGMGGDDGIADGPGAGGGGLLTNGGDGYMSCVGGKAFINGGAGGAGSTGYGGGDGGFGGGGGGAHNSLVRSGGAGGYSGGQGGSWAGQHSGGGGGSYNHGTNKSDTAGARSGNGEVKITY